MMAFERVRVGHEVRQKRGFSWAVDWPGCCRAGRDIDAADVLDHAWEIEDRSQPL